MNITFYWIQFVNNLSLINIDDFNKLLGDNFPIPLPLEGGDYNGPQYIYAINSLMQVLAVPSICSKYKLKYHTYNSIDINDDLYNNNHTISISYSNHLQPYSIVHLNNQYD